MNKIVKVFPNEMEEIVKRIHEVQPSLFLTGLVGLRSANFKVLKITMIINTTLELRHPIPCDVPNIELVRVPVKDLPTENIDIYFDDTSEKIYNEIHTKQGKVLVHCAMGCSRSVSFVLAYMMKKLKIPLRTAYEAVKSRRSCISPNLGFWKQLISYEKKIFGKNTINMIQKGGFGPQPNI